MTLDVTRPDSTRAQFLRRLRTDLCAIGSAWLHREFDAIIAANFGEPREARRRLPPRTDTGSGRKRKLAPMPSAHSRTRLTHGFGTAGVAARQRSPPS